MNTNNAILDKLKEFLSEDEIKQGIEKGVIKLDIEKNLDAKELERMPLTNNSPGLGSGTGPINETMAGMANWQMVKAMMEKAMADMEKAYRGMHDYMSKADYKDEEDKDMEKAYGQMMGTADQMKKAMKMYKAKMKMNKSFDDDDQDRIEKSLEKYKAELQKSFDEQLSGFKTSNEQLVEKNTLLATQNETLQKSLDELSGKLSTMQENVEKMSKQTPAPKSIPNLQNYIEKGGVKDNDGKKIYHIGIHKNQIIDELQKATHEADDILKSKIEEDIINFSAAGIAPSEAVSRLMYEKYDVKFVR